LDTTFYIILKLHFTYNVFVIIKSIGKVHCRTGDEGPEGVEVLLYSFSNLRLDGCGWSTPCRGRFTHGNEAQYPLYRSLGGPLGPVCMNAF